MTKQHDPQRGALESTVSVDDAPPVPGLPADGHIGRYIVRGLVGSGGMGLVVAAYDPELDRHVAIKLVATGREESRARLVREAQAMARLSHPNVVTVHEVVRIGDRAGIVMELVEGEDLAAWRDGGEHSWRQAVELYVQAARGLAAAHRAGIVHRDFKPSNALLGKDGVVRVTDFGLARSLSAGDVEPPSETPASPGATPAASAFDTPRPLGATLTQTGAIVGTPAYMAPEQHLGAVVDARTDQWALACSLYEAVYGERPFTGDSPQSLRDNVLRQAWRPAPSEARVPRALRAALLRALSTRPDDRFADMDAFIAAVMAPARRASRITAAAVTAVAVAVAIVGAVVLRRTASAPSCAGLDAPLVAAWNPDTAKRLRAHLSSVGGAAAAADRLLAVLDEYGRKWTAARADACTQTRQGVRSDQALDRRMRCLDQRLVEMSTLVAGLADADARTAAAAGDAVDRLHPVSDCAEPRETTPLPASRAARDQIAAAERDLARAWAAEELSQYERALALAASAAEVGRKTGWPPLEARALVLAAECQQRHRDFDQALASLDRAASVAATGKEDAVLAEALAARFFILDEDLGRPDEALAGRTYVELALARAGNPPDLRARWLHFLAISEYRHHDDVALAYEVEAVGIWRKILRPDSARLLDSLETEANIQINRKQFDVAESLLREVLAGRIAARGPDDPLVASAEDNFGVLEFTRVHIEAAIEHWERAASISERSGTRNWRIHSNLGEARTELGHLHAAVADFEKACAMVEREAPGDSAYAGECTTSLGSVLTQLGQLDRAAPLIERGLAIGRKTRSAGLPIALFTRAKHALVRGDVAAAAADLRELGRVDEDGKDPMLAVLTAEVTRAQSGCRAAAPAIAKARALVADDPYQSERMEASFVAADCDVELGQPAQAIATLEPDLAWLEQHYADAEAIAPVRFTLARALAASGRDRARARALAEAALPSLFGRDRDDAVRWLRRDAAR